MFYNLVSVIAMNSFLLSTYAPAAKENKFSTYLAFREALCKGLFVHAKSHSTVIVAGPITAVVTNKVAVDAADTAGARVKHQRVKMKRSACVICKQAAAEERRGIKQQKRQVLQAISPNIVDKCKDRHVLRVKTGCASCKVSLCTKKGCWEVFHSGAIPA